MIRRPPRSPPFPYTPLFRSQVGPGGGAPPRRGIQHAPQLPDLPQQQARLGAAHGGLLREQPQAQLVELDQRLERLGVQPALRQSPALAAGPVLRLALQQHGPPLQQRDAMVTEPGREATREFGNFLPNLPVEFCRTFPTMY